MKKINCKSIIIISVIFSVLFLLELSAKERELIKLSELDIPLTLTDTSGYNRVQDISSTGVPLPHGLLLKPEGIAVYDSKGVLIPAQFRVLERWRDEGLGKNDLSIKWLLVTFMADVQANSKSVYHLKAGKNPMPTNPVSIKKIANGYEMGGLTFNKDFTQPFNLSFTDPKGNVSTAKDLPLKWSIWEEGPLRSCLKVESSTVPDKFGFMAWVYTYAGKKQWDMTIVLKNGVRVFRGPLQFKDFSVEWNPKDLANAQDFLLGGETGKAFSGKINNGPAYIHQATSGTKKWESDGTTWMDKKANKGEFRGFKVFSGTKELGTGDAAAGWGVLNGSKGALVLTQYFRAQYPKAMEIQKGKLIARLWPKYKKSASGIHWLDDIQRKAHNLSFRLSNKPFTTLEAEKASKSFDAPLYAHAPADWYRVVRPHYEGGYNYVKKWKSAQTKGWFSFGFEYPRNWKGYSEIPMDLFLKSGRPEEAYYLHARVLAASTVVPMYMDDYQFPRDKKMLETKYGRPFRSGSKKLYRPGTHSHGMAAYNPSHFTCKEVYDGWRLFGSPVALDATKKLSTYCQSWVSYRQGTRYEEFIPNDKPSHYGATSAWKGGRNLTAGEREDGLPLRNLVEGYRITGDEGMLKSLKEYADMTWRQMDKVRGFYALTGGAKLQYSIYDHIGTFRECQVMAGLYSYYKLTGDERAADMIFGWINFIQKYALLDIEGYPYMKLAPLDPKEGEIYRQAYLKRIPNAKKWQQKAMYVNPFYLVFSYQQTGEDKFLDVIKRTGGLKFNNPHFATKGFVKFHPFREELKDVLTKKKSDVTPPVTITDLSVEAVGDGKVKLTWTAPKGNAVRYQIKWADKPMVPQLKFPEQKDSHVNWWAAHHVDNEPKVLTAGTKQSVVVDVNDQLYIKWWKAYRLSDGIERFMERDRRVIDGTRYFAIRAYDASSNRSVISNQPSTKVK